MQFGGFSDKSAFLLNKINESDYDGRLTQRRGLMSDESSTAARDGYETSYDLAGLNDRWRSVVPPQELPRNKEDIIGIPKNNTIRPAPDNWDLM